MQKQLTTLLLMLLVLVSLIAFGQHKKTANEGAHEAKLQSQRALHAVQQDVAIAEVLQELKREAAHGLLAFRNVRIIDPLAESISAA